MLPVATLPAAALFIGIANWIDPKNVNIVSAFLFKTGNTITGNLGILFAIGLAIGMAKDKNGASALAGLVGFLTVTSLLGPTNAGAFLGFDGSAAHPVPPAFNAVDNSNVFFGILTGLIAAALYNKFRDTKLPTALAFFSGRRLVPILSVAAMAVVSLFMLFAWPFAFNALTMFGKAIVGLGWFGAGLYGFFNRLLIPTGLHHALNNVFWFNIAGINDIGNFWSGKGTFGVTGMYQAGFYPVLMFGLPAAAFAIYRCAKPENKKQTKSLMMAAAFATFFTGVSEPLEFSFMFDAWPLYIVHAVLMGISVAFAAFMHWTSGFNFSAGLVDYVLAFRSPMADKPYMLLVQGVVMALLYYFVFTFMIKKFNLNTPGREDVSTNDDTDAVAKANGVDRFVVMADRFFKALGGSDNLKVVDNCTTRLRLTVADSGIIDQAAIKAAGAAGVKIISKDNVQIIVGTEVQFVADALEEFRSHAREPLTDEASRAQVEADMAAVPVESASESVTQDIVAPTEGKLIPIEQVSDETFAEKMLGDGYAVQPTNGDVRAPLDGTVSTVFPTKHAIGIITDSGLEVLLHMGIDTVQLKGTPFTVLVKEGDVLTAGQKVAEADLDAIKAAGKGTDMIVVFTNGDKVASLKVNPSGNVKVGEVVGSVTSK